jgi:hypothetical protein
MVPATRLPAARRFRKSKVAHVYVVFRVELKYEIWHDRVPQRLDQTGLQPLRDCN